uniref:Putative golgi organization n=1 Tax=Corethrella appendiculata TaxID=1370023 RepID=U5EFL1_9DIPT
MFSSLSRRILLSSGISQNSQITSILFKTLEQNPHQNFTVKKYSSNSITTPTTATIPKLENEGFLQKLKKKFGWHDNSKSRLRVSSCILYETVADSINYAAFFVEFNLPDTFNSWFLVTELHVWMLLVRAMAEGSEQNEDGRFVRNCIVETMWNDVNTRANKLGADNPSGVRKQIHILSEQFQAALIGYDEAICSNDMVLASAIWRRFFAQECDDYTKLELLVGYVRKQISMLDKMTRQDFLIRPKVKWLPLREK